ncbi:hypothetical protein GRS48_08490 [Halorubrum sp. JWXQ-INN 858]|uniref:UvrD-helicase domain-containing protein n=1 Tax=Halorubrum sp. JWXQ-INN 858 TaxID=2690782 RepID=UPI001357D086|nr:UvrD-helicase domain-containing protein [Halorubrum sp. JWXQ-INN 858]MWV64856.1 hypothetical protein [Halorubrum sp. JWXQ-INN 858]
MSDPPRLDDGQRAAVDAYLGTERGLVTLASVPGAGKSTVAGKAVAAELLDRTAAGDPLAHERVVSASFSREDAADIVPDVTAWLDALYERGETPDSIDRADVDRLQDAVRAAPRIGTVDGVLRSVFADVATAVGFDAMPTVGNAALVERVHRDAFDRLLADDRSCGPIERIREAYETTGSPVDVGGLLRRSLVLCRRHGIAPDAFGDRLAAAVADNYGGDEPTGFDDVIEAVDRYRDPETAARLRAADALSEADREAIAAADRRLHAAWLDAVDDLGRLVARYVPAYDDRCREVGAVSHLDCAHWVDRYFDRPAYRGPRRERLRDRYHAGIGSVVIDEAQDVSRVQHDALAHLVDDATRVLLAGDLQQCIYQWRDATPELFGRAIETGDYFGRRWSPHVDGTADRNYRSRPGIVRFTNAVAARTLDHPERGGLGDVPAPVPSLHAAREVPTDAASPPPIHVAAFSPTGEPGRDGWVDPERGGREAAVVARYVAGALASGRLTADDGGRPGITVLFSRRRYMDAYATAFEARGLTVANASAHLFETPVVEAVVDVVSWLVDPTDPERTERLVTDSALATATLPDELAAFDWSVRDAAGADAFTGGDAELVAGLAGLVTDARDLAADPGAVVVRDVIDRLRLEADPYGLDPDTGRRQRLATLDALVALIADWEDGDRYGPRELCALLEPFLADPSTGPTRPLADPDAVDVVFSTVHGMKGDQDDVVVLADTARPFGTRPTDTRRLAVDGDRVALAPPASAVDGDTPAVPGVAGGLFTPDPYADRHAGPGGDGAGSVGLRWQAEHWRSTAVTQGETTADAEARLVGPPVRRGAAAAERSEAWRVLHVAITRARDHLVVPLPRNDDRLSGRDHWAQPLFDVLGADVVSARGHHEVSLPDGDGVDCPTRVVVNDVPLDAVVDAVDAPESSTAHPSPTPSTSLTPPLRRLDGPVPTDDVDRAWIPRFLSPSTLGPRLDDPAGTLVAALRGESPHTDGETVADDLPLAFAAVTTDAVGDVVHALVTALVRADASAMALASPSPGAVAAVDDVLATHRAVADASDAELAGLRTFLLEWVLPDLADSALWERVERAETVYTDEPLQALARVRGVDVELQGEADLLVVSPDGTHHVEDVKASLTTPSPDQRRRYRLQVGTYAWILGRQVADDVDVVPRVTTVGVAAEEYGVDWPVGAWTRLVGRAERDSRSEPGGRAER